MRSLKVIVILGALVMVGGCAPFIEKFSAYSVKYLCKLSPEARAELIVKINDELEGSGVTYTAPPCP